MLSFHLGRGSSPAVENSPRYHGVVDSNPTGAGLFSSSILFTLTFHHNKSLCPKSGSSRWCISMNDVKLTKNKYLALLPGAKQALKAQIGALKNAFISLP